jgi:hypothetical protein
MDDLKSSKELWDEAREKLESEPPSGEELEQLRVAITEQIPQLMRHIFGPPRDWLGELQMARARSDLGVNDIVREAVDDHPLGSPLQPARFLFPRLVVDRCRRGRYENGMTSRRLLLVDRRISID